MITRRGAGYGEKGIRGLNERHRKEINGRKL